MPRTCSVPHCDTNFHSVLKVNPTIVATFAFPSDPDQRQKWLRAIHRENFVPTKHSAVCIRHFHEEHIVRISKRKKTLGQVLKFPYLTEDAVPGIFLEQPSYMTTEPPSNRKDPEERRLALNERNEAEFEDWQVKDQIKSFQDLCDNYNHRDLFNFNVQKFPEFLYFYKTNVSLNSIPEISHGVKIFTNLKMQAYVGNLPLPSKRFKGMLNNDLECVHWSAFESLLSHLGSLEASDVSTFVNCMEELCAHVDRILQQWTPSLTNYMNDDNSPILTKLSFFREQIKLLTRKIPRYSSDLILWSCSIYFAFPAAYVMMRDANVLTLPHPSHLKRISGDLKSEAGVSKDQVSYLTTKFKNMEEYERTVNVLFDEIHTVPTVNYTGGKIVGMAPNNEGATKVQAFMLSSAFGNKEDIAALFPVNNTDAEKLKEMLLKVIEVLTKIGFETLSLICDNNRMNRSVYKLLSGGGEVKKSIPNPFKESSQIFLLFDSVHIKKCLRNNWLNQKNPEQSFYFPLMDNPSVIMSANVKDLKDIYHREKNEILKLAPALSQKVLYPTSLERQNVNIALRLFDEKNIVALEKYAPDGYSATAEYMKEMSPWFKIMNVRAPETGIHKRDPLQNPIRSADDENLKRLEKVKTFVTTWHSSNTGQKTINSGKLTNDTYFAFIHTTETIILLCKYVFENFPGVKYILLGFFQTDRLEWRFGKYRKMSGCNYHVSVSQILESERKLKVMSLLKLRSTKYGDFQIADLDPADVPEDNDFEINDSPFYVCLDASDGLEINETEGSILYFLAGYCSHQLLTFVGDCTDCKKVVANDGRFEIEAYGMSKETREYLTNLTRGGLKEPTPILNEVVSNVYRLFATLISAEFEDAFLKIPSQRGLLKRLALKKLEFIVDMDEKCGNEKCGRSTRVILTKVSNTLANIFLNNYCKKKNDKVRVGKKRKLDTFAATQSDPTKKKRKKKVESKHEQSSSKEKGGQDAVREQSKPSQPSSNN